MMQSNLALSGALNVRKVSRRPSRWVKWRAIWGWRLRNFFVQRWREVPLEVALFVIWLLTYLVKGLNLPMHGRLYLRVIKADGEVWDYGCAGCHLIVTAGKNYLTGCFDNTNEAENLKYHGYGTGTNAAGASDTGLQTELTTEYAVNSTRPTGSQSKSTNVYTTVGTLTPDSGGTIAVTEWGLFSAASSTTLFDRQVFSAVNVVASADSLETTYALTVG